MKAGEMRQAVLQRDDYRCQARVIDPKAGPCRDEWGVLLPENPLSYDLEADYVWLRAKGKRHDLPEDHLMLCAGHHRGTGAQQGYIWATSHRAEMRAWLDELYEVAA